LAGGPPGLVEILGLTFHSSLESGRDTARPKVDLSVLAI
jgi:hypothetical protein